MRRPAPRSASFAHVAEHGGYFCTRCQRYVDTEDAQNGYRKCCACGSYHVRHDPPVPGYHPSNHGSEKAS